MADTPVNIPPPGAARRHNYVYTERLGRHDMAAKGARDRKEESLRASRTLNPRPGAVTDGEFGSSEFFDARDMVQVKYEMVRSNRAGGEPVARAAASFGLSRPAFYQAAAALDADGLAGLVPKKPGPKGGHKLTAEMVGFVVEARAADPGAGAGRLADLVFSRFGTRVHRRTVERALAKESKRPGRR
jgi:hypothetical protein